MLTHPIRIVILVVAAVICGAALKLPVMAQEKADTRDEFFWLGQINKATAVINTDEGLLDKAIAPSIAAGVAKVIEEGGKPAGERPTTVITFEPLLIKAAGPEVTLLHAGRSSQDMHATYRAAILREEVLGLADQLNKCFKIHGQAGRASHPDHRPELHQRCCRSTEQLCPLPARPRGRPRTRCTTSARSLCAYRPLRDGYNGAERHELAAEPHPHGRLLRLCRDRG